MTIRFTRYLFSVDRVVLSLKRALQNRAKDEALYWTYELYYSGFVEEAWQTVTDMYDSLWAITSPKYQRHIHNKKTNTNTPTDTGIGSVVLTLCARDPAVPNDEKFVFSLSETALNPYRTFVCDDNHKMVKPRKYLEHVTKYCVYFDEDNDQKVDAELNAAYLGGDWTWYCWSTPYWRQIFDTYGMVEDVANNRTNFPNDDVLEAFYDKYGYEPDEQSRAFEESRGVFL